MPFGHGQRPRCLNIVDNDDDNDNNDGHQSKSILKTHLLAFGSGELIMHFK